MKALKIEMVHDVVCSWCPIGYANVKQALISDELIQQLLLKKTHVQQLELSSVPAFISNETKLVSGSNSVEYFQQVIQDLSTPTN